VAVEPEWENWGGVAGAVTLERAQRVIWPGSMNTRADVETFFQGCELAFERSPGLHVVVTGGPIRGHEEQTFERFSRWVEGSSWKNRWHLTGWISAADAAREVTSARAGVSLDRVSVEALLGSRTRLLYGVALGLPWIVTPGNELVDRLIELGWAVAVPHGDARALSEAILEATSDTSTIKRDWEVRQDVLERYSSTRTALPLITWLENPESAPTGMLPEHALEERLVELEKRLAAVQNSLTWRVLSPIHRFVRRLFRGE